MKLKLIHIIFLSVFFMSAVGLWIFQVWTPADATEITLAGKHLQVLVADNPLAQHKGLGKRKSLAPYDGMLFPFPGAPTRHGIVMRDMQFSIDVVWLKDGIVVDIAPSLPIDLGASEGDLTPYFSRDKANAVLELAAGWAKTHGLKIGDILLTNVVE